jgi:hypothetical protein
MGIRDPQLASFRGLMMYVQCTLPISRRGQARGAVPSESTYVKEVLYKHSSLTHRI